MLKVRGSMARRRCIRTACPMFRRSFMSAATSRCRQQPIVAGRIPQDAAIRVEACFLREEISDISRTAPATASTVITPSIGAR